MPQSVPDAGLERILDNVALTIIGNISNPIWFSKIDLKNAYSEMALSRQCNFSIVGGNVRPENYRFKTRLYGLGDLRNEL